MAVREPSPNNSLRVYPKDFALYHIGDFNNETGGIQECQPEIIYTAEKALDEENADRQQNTENS